MDQGTGKTLTALKMVGNLYKKGKIKNVLILAPKSVLSVWEQEIEDSLLIPYAYGGEVLKPTTHPKALVIGLFNYEKSKSIKGKANKVKANKSWDMIIADESHRVKNPNSIQSKQVYFLARNAKYRLCLSGTPQGNSEMDYFAQYKIINDKIFGAKTTDFKKNWMIRGGWMDKKCFLDETKRSKFEKLINKYSYRVTKEECLDLPGITETVIKVPLDPKTQKAYDKLKKDKLLKLGDEDYIEADLAITLATKLQQLSCGFIYDENGEAIHMGKMFKLSYLEDILSDRPKEKVVVFCKYVHEIECIKKKLGKKYKILTYDNNSKAGDWKKFNKSKYDILLTSMRKGGTGLNLQIASTVVFFSLSYSYIDLSQAKDRVYRKGQTQKVSVYYLLGRDTIEEYIYKVLKDKKSGAQKILDEYRKSLLEKRK